MKEKRNPVLLMSMLLTLMLLVGSTLCGDESRAMLLRHENKKPAAVELTSAERLTTAFVSLQNYWRQQFMANDEVYSDARLVLFREAVTTACGDDLLGSFYCPLDRSVYIDLGRHSSSHDQSARHSDNHLVFVLAHEVGHHVQALRGIEAEAARQKLQHPNAAEAVSHQLELQADCIAGIAWRALGNDDSTESLMDELVDHGANGDASGRMHSFRHGVQSVRLSGCSLQVD